MSEQPQTPEVGPVVEEAPPAESQQVVVRKQPKPLSLRDPGQLARAFAESGYWKHVTRPAQAVVIMAHGEELGLSPLASMQGITIIENKIGYTGGLLNQLIASHPRYSVRKLVRTNERCTLQFLIDGAPPVDEPEEGKVTFTVEDAERMELVKPRSNWVKTPRAMCFWRCLTEGARVHFPDLTTGTPVYSTEEIEEVVTQEPVRVPNEEAAPTLSPERVGHLSKGIAVSGLIAEEVVAERGWGDLNVLLGSIGIDSFDPAKGLDGQLATLTEEQADALDSELQKLAEGGEDGVA